jgi:hypothetical protein
MSEEDIAGFDVAVDQLPALEGKIQPGGHPDGDIQHIDFIQAALLHNDVIEGVVPDKFHHQVIVVEVFTERIDLDDIGVGQGSGDFHFPEKGADEFFVSREFFAQEFDRDHPIEVHIGGPVDRSHPPFADEFFEPIFVEILPDHEAVFTVGAANG